MRQQRYKDCVHKIVTFQNHKHCQEFAAICEKQCQLPHLANNPPAYVDVDIVRTHFNNIKNHLIDTMKFYSDKFSTEYEHLMKIFQKKYTENLREMEKEMLGVLIKAINLNKDVLDKIENQRLEKLKCHEIYTFLEQEANLQAKIKSAALLPIYDKHLNSLRLHHKNFNWNLSIQANSKGNANSTPPNKQTAEEIQELKNSIQTYKKEAEKLNQQIKTYQSELLKSKQAKQRNLSQKTWNFLKLKTRKRAKNKKGITPQDASNTVPVHNKQAMVSEGSEKRQIMVEENCDSQDILDFIEKRKTT